MSKLLEQVKNVIRTRHSSYRTEQSYVHWIKQYIYFHHKRHPAEMGATEVSQFLTHFGSGSTSSSFHAEPGAGGVTLPLSKRAWPNPDSIALDPVDSGLDQRFLKSVQLS